MTTLKALALAAVLISGAALGRAQEPTDDSPATPSLGSEARQYRIDFRSADLKDVVDAMAKVLGKRIIYDERVRGEITMISEELMSAQQARLMFESALEVKGFTMIEGPSGELKVIPARDASVSPLRILEPGQAPSGTLEFVTKFISLRYVKVDSILDQLRQLASRDARLIADPRTNSVIVSDQSAIIKRMLVILESIDVATYEEQTKVIQLQHANAVDLTKQLGEMFGAQSSGQSQSVQAQTAAAFVAARAAATGTPVDANLGAGVIGAAGAPRFIPDPRTNSIIAMAPQATISQVERVITLLDYKRPNRGGINIYKLQNADAEDVAETLSALGGGGGGGSRGSSGGDVGGLSSTGASFGATSNSGSSGGGAQSAQLEGGTRVTADAPTNSLIIQSTPEAYASMVDVIQQLDTRRPQVMMEAAILEVNVGNDEKMGTNLVYNTLFGGDTLGSFGTNPTGTGATRGLFSPNIPGLPGIDPKMAGNFTSTIARRFIEVLTNPNDPNSKITVPVVQGLIVAAKNDSNTNILATPKVLTADNEEAEIKVGENRGFPESSLSAVNQGNGTDPNNNFQTQTNIVRKDVGVTMRITPQISEGDSVRMKIFTEISNVTDANNRFGPTTNSRTIQNTVYVKDGESVMIGGIIQDQLVDSTNGVPFLSDIWGIGRLFRNDTKAINKTNLIMVLTPRIVRDPKDLTQLTLEGREKFRQAGDVNFDDDEEKERDQAQKAGLDLPNDPNPVRRELSSLTNRYPTDKLPTLREERQIREEERQQKLQEIARTPNGSYLVQVALLDKASDAASLLERLIQSGYDGVMLSRDENGQTVHYVQLGPYPSEAEAQKIGREVKAETGFTTYVMIQP